MAQLTTIISIEHLTHDVLRIVCEKPTNLQYVPGQAIDISIAKEAWEQELRAFTFTSLPSDDHLEFCIKTYPEHEGVTAQLLALKKGDQLLLHDVFGDIHYKGEGLFIAGGAGVTPFLAILKQLEKDQQLGHNKLLFANKSQSDIILEKQFQQWLGSGFVNVLSEETCEGYEHGFITADLIQKCTDTYTQYYYLCGPEPMMQAIEKQLAGLGIVSEFIVKEAF